jgi:holliday junction DNA helicase RuvA
MIVQLTGTLVEVLPSHIVIDVHGVGYELGCSSTTAAALPPAGEAGVTVLTRLIVREDAQELYGFATREERALFDQLRAISGVGPKLALAVLSTFTAAQLATVVATEDAARMAQVPGVGKKKASRLLVELSDVFSKNAELRGLVGLSATAPGALKLDGSAQGAASPSVDAEAAEALLSMGFTPQECELALEGHEAAGAVTIEKTLAYALKRLGSGR